MGGDSGQIAQPQMPTAPSYSSSIQDYIQNYPELFQLQQQYAPQIAAMQKKTQEQLYPNQAGLGEQLGGIASQGMTTEASDWYTQNTRDQLKSTFGRNLVFNPRAQEQYGVSTQQAAEDWKRYYQNMGMSLAGKQPQYGAETGITQSYQPAQALSYNQNMYNTQAGLYGTNLNAWQNQNTNPWANIAGSIAGGIGSGIGTGVGMYSMKKFGF
jgi:hypothetical protein